jgi:hypothetical protein
VNSRSGLLCAGQAAAQALARQNLVRAVGIEPTLLSEPDFESGASTSFTTPAWRLPISEAFTLSKP